MDPITLIVTALAAGSRRGALEALQDDVTISGSQPVQANKVP